MAKYNGICSACGAVVDFEMDVDQATGRTVFPEGTATCNGCGEVYLLWAKSGKDGGIIVKGKESTK